MADLGLGSQGSAPIERRLVTVLACDFVGYSRNMSRDEEDTVAVLRSHRAVIDDVIHLHGGRIFTTAGDSVLSEFNSPVQAVRCATEIQAALLSLNRSLAEDRRLLLRIGINLGDVLVQDGNLLGDAVNVAARLESLAEPGGICIAQSVFDQIQGKLDLGFQPIGPQNLKNIGRPIAVFRLGAVNAVPPMASPGVARRGRTRRLIGVAAAAVAAVAITSVVLISRGGGVAPATIAAVPVGAPPQVPAAATNPAAAPITAGAWASGRWIGIVTRTPVTDPMFCTDLDDRCRILQIHGTIVDGAGEGRFGFPNRLGPAEIDVAGDVIKVKTTAPTFVQASLTPTGFLEGTLTDRFGNTYPIKLRRSR